VTDIRHRRNGNRILVEKSQGMSLLGRPRCRGQGNITCVVKTETRALGTGQLGCGQENVSGCCEHGDERCSVAEELVGAVGGFGCMHLTHTCTHTCTHTHIYVYIQKEGRTDGRT
jgi:hypothetical protein